jgi:hypothetical protein
VSPLGRPSNFGTGARILLRRLQSRVRVTATVLSSLELSSFPRVGKASCVTVPEWCSSVPSSRFELFSRMGRGAPARESCRAALRDEAEGGWAERLYTFTRSSVAPVARKTFWDWPGVGAEGGDRARQRIAEVWAVKRKVSAKETDGESGFIGLMVAVTPWRTRS